MSLTGMREREIPPQYAVSPVILGPVPLSEVFLNNRIMDLHHLCITNLSRPMTSVFVSTFVWCWFFLNYNYFKLHKKFLQFCCWMLFKAMCMYCLVLFPVHFLKSTRYHTKRGSNSQQSAAENVIHSKWCSWLYLWGR